MNPSTSNALKTLRERAAAIVKTASSIPDDPTNKGSVAVPPSTDRAALAPSTPGVDNRNAPTMKPEDAAIMQVTNPGKGPDVPTRSGAEHDAALDSPAARKMANLRDTLARLTVPAAAPAAPAAEKKADAPPAAPAAQVASGEVDAATMKVAYDQFAAIGAALCASEEGRQLVERQLQKQAGEARAAQMMEEAVKAAAVYEQVGYALEVAQHEEQAKLAAAQEVIGQLSPSEQEAAVKLAAARQHAYESGVIANAFEDAWFLKGAAMAEAMMPGGAAAGADPAAGLPGAGDAAAGADPEAILQAVMEAVQAGQMTEEEAKALLESYGLTIPGGTPAEEDPAAKQASAILAEAFKPAAS